MNSKKIFYKKKYLKYKTKYLKLKGGYSPYKIDDLQENTRFYEEKFLRDYAYLPKYTHSFVKIESPPTNEVLNNIFNFHQRNNYEQNGFENLKNTVLNPNLPNRTTFTYILFPKNNIVIDKESNFGFDRKVEIRFHRIDSAFEFFSKHDYIVERYAQLNNISKYKQPVFCGGEFYFDKDRNGDVKLYINRQSGTVAGCWKANVNLTGLFKNFTHLPTEEYPDSFIDRNSLIPSFFEDYDYLMNLHNLGLKIKFYKEKEDNQRQEQKLGQEQGQGQEQEQGQGQGQEQKQEQGQEQKQEQGQGQEQKQEQGIDITSNRKEVFINYNTYDSPK
jgi:hypothetical protein